MNQTVALQMVSDATPVGYAALIKKYNLDVPLPETLCAVGKTHKQERYDEVERLRIFSSEYDVQDTLFGHLTFALKYEGVDLSILSRLFAKIPPEDIAAIVQTEPNGSYSRRIWFLYEWLLDTRVDIPDARTSIKYTDALDVKLQYPGPDRPSKRHRVMNNLPGVREFCPIIRKTDKLDSFLAMDVRGIAKKVMDSVPLDISRRAIAFLLLDDTKASYIIEGEKPPQDRLQRWARVVAAAGNTSLSSERLEELQKEIIVDDSFVRLGYRDEGGFIGQHDRSGMPRPAHISAKPDDLHGLMTGLLETESLLKNGFPPILAAASVGFGFVFIHPFQDGNGRLHRYIINHVLAAAGTTPEGVVFPVSAVILERLQDYKRTLENFSQPRLPLIEWKVTEGGNVCVTNDTADLYRYFDATKQAEFLYDCIVQTVTRNLPDEVKFLARYDAMKNFVNEYLDIPDHKASLLVLFLHQNGGMVSKKKHKKEFPDLTDEHLRTLEQNYSRIFCVEPPSLADTAGLPDPHEDGR